MRHLKKAIIVLSTIMTIGTSMVAGATEPSQGQWKQDNHGWWYEFNDGSYVVNSWYQADGNWYYFYADGYMAANTTTPDGYYVDQNGVWSNTPPQQLGDYKQEYKNIVKGIYDSLPTYANNRFEIMLSDLNGDGIEELMVGHYSVKQPLERAYSAYTYMNGAITPLVVDQSLYADAGGPYHKMNVVTKDGNTALFLLVHTTLTGSDYSYTMFDNAKVYDFDGSQWMIQESADYTKKLINFDPPQMGEIGSITTIINGNQITSNQEAVFQGWVSSFENLNITMYGYDEFIQ